MEIFDKIGELLKAKEKETEPIEKAKEAKEKETENKETEDDKYNESYMKKYMPKFMEHNKKYMGKYMKKADEESGEGGTSNLFAETAESVSDQLQKAGEELNKTEAEHMIIQGDDIFKGTQALVDKLVQTHGETFEVMKSEIEVCVNNKKRQIVI